MAQMEREMQTIKSGGGGLESWARMVGSWRGFRLPARRRACSPPLHSTSISGVFLSPRPPLNS